MVQDPNEASGVGYSFGGFTIPDLQIAMDEAARIVKQVQDSSAAIAAGTPREAAKSMADAPTREEIDARFATLSAEMRASSSDLRGDFARSSEQVTTTVAALAIAVADLKGSIGGAQGSIDGLKTSMNTMQWFIASLIALFGLLGAGIGIWIAIAQLKQAEVPAAQAPSPVVIQVPYPQQSGIPPAATPAPSNAAHSR